MSDLIPSCLAQVTSALSMFADTIKVLKRFWDVLMSLSTKDLNLMTSLSGSTLCSKSNVL